MIAMPNTAEPPQLTWQAEEVVRKIDDRPHLLVRVSIRGGYFPQRALVPFVRLVEGDTEHPGVVHRDPR